MKTQSNRIHRNGATKPAVSQPQTQRGARPAPAKVDHFDTRLELEDAKNQSNALAVLLADFYDYQVSNGFLAEGEADKISAGIGQLVRVTSQRLEAAVDQSLATMTSATN